MLFLKPRTSLYLSRILLASVAPMAIACGSDEGTAPNPGGDDFTEIVYAVRQHTRIEADGAVDIEVASGMGQVMDYRRFVPGARIEVRNLASGDVRNVIGLETVNAPKGSLSSAQRTIMLDATDQLIDAPAYRDMVVAYRNGAPVRLSDLGQVVDSVQDLRNAGISNGKPAVLVILNRQPSANIIETADRVRDVLPQLQASIPNTIDLNVVMERTSTIRLAARASTL